MKIGVSHSEGFSSQVEEATDDPNEQSTMEIRSQSPIVARLLQQAAKIAKTDKSVLLLGETGVGKGLLAEAIHHRSLRRQKEFVKVNCADMSRGLIRSEFFGHEKGAFTSAFARHRGHFEQAHGGTLFLDEIGDLPLETQGVLLHILEGGSLRRVGGTTSVRVNVRIIAATNRDLPRAVGDGTFRKDLFQRLSVLPLVVPPLSTAAMAYLKAYDWPGNVRELEHWIERMAVLHEGEPLELADVLEAEKMGQPLSPAASAPEAMDQALPPVDDEDELQRIIAALRKANWIVAGPRGAAQLLGMSDRMLQYRMRKYGIQRPK